MPESIDSAALLDLLRQRGITMEAAAMLAGVETSTVLRIVRGQAKPRPQTVVSLARALGISPKRLESMATAAWNATHSEKVQA